MIDLKKYTGLYGGTFNPVHFGHLNLAVEALETCGLEQILYCPARLSPHKLNEEPVSAEHRLQMLKLAVEGIPHCHVLDIELKRPGPSYTVETVEYLIAKEQKSPRPRKFCLVLGNDSVAEFHRWHRVEDLIKLVPLVVGTRSTPVNLDKIQGSPELRQAIQAGYIQTKIFDISSTEVRDRLKQKKFCGHLVPQKVLDYIYTNHLYF